MKLQQKIAKSNINITNINSFEKTICNKEYSTSITVEFLNAIGQKTNTNISVDNVLIFGSNSEYNQLIASFLYSSFKRNHLSVRIVTTSQFLSIPVDRRRGGEEYYIVVCDDHNICRENLSDLNDFTGTQILFKIPNIKPKLLREIESVYLYTTTKTKQQLQALNIDESKAVTMGLLASLEEREFCVKNSRNITKRTL